jgi:outer membrane immunogenic protein
MIRSLATTCMLCTLPLLDVAKAQELPSVMRPIGSLPAPANVLIPNYTSAMRSVDWTGFYVNPLLGYQSASFSGRGGRSLKQPSGATLGAEAGYHWQFGSFVIGPAADLSYAFMKGKERAGGPAGLRSEVDWFGSARVRAGFTVDRMLFYGTGGFAFAGAEVSSRVTRLSNERVLKGWTAGVGAEYAWSPNASLRLEYRRVALQGRQFRALPRGRDKPGLDMDVVNMAFAYRF